MKIAFFSNFLVPHQVAFCEAMCRQPGVEFTFVAAQPFAPEQVTAGFTDINTQYAFCLPSYRSEADAEAARQLCRGCDVLLMGAAPESWLRLRMKAGGLTFRVSERLFKPQYHTKKDLVAVAMTFKGNSVYRNKPFYLLSAGAYSAADYAYCGAFRGKAFKWGYFPQGSTCTETELAAQKAHGGPVKALWAGRLIDWKHPEAALNAIAYCKEKQLDIHLDVAGSGPLEQQIKDLAESLNIVDAVSFLGALPNEKTIEAMQRADIYLATSDENEGWGAVVNEAMSAGCAVIASEQMGSVPYLIQHRENGIRVPSPAGNAFGEALAALLTEERNAPGTIRGMGSAACRTVRTVWSPAAAAENLTALCASLLQGKSPEVPAQGPCSRAEETT